MSKSLITRSTLVLATITMLGSAVQAQVPGWNPVIIDSGKQITGVTYDPFTGRIRVRTDHTKVRESVNDPNRGRIDPGSYEYVNEYQTDRNGCRWHVTGYRWTSYGVPHGNLNRRRVSGVSPGIDHDENENVVYSPMGNQNNRNTAKPPANRVVPGMIPSPRYTTPRTNTPGNQGPTFPRTRVSGPYGTNVNPFLKSASQRVQNTQKYNPF